MIDLVVVNYVLVQRTIYRNKFIQIINSVSAEDSRVRSSSGILLGCL